LYSAQGTRIAQHSNGPSDTIADLMRLRNVGLGVIGALVVLGAVVAGATVWLLLTNPVTIANAVNDGEISPFMQDLARVIFDALRGLLKYL
jgi:hypothetical protein